MTTGIQINSSARHLSGSELSDLMSESSRESVVKSITRTLFIQCNPDVIFSFYGLHDPMFNLYSPRAIFLH